MIDLHCHMLPGIDDGAVDITTSLQMARAQVADGVSVVACTPDIMPGQNTGLQIRQAVDELQHVLDQENIPLRLVAGSDNHITPDFVEAVKAGHLLSLGDSRYVLVKPPHDVAPIKLAEFFFNLIVAGYVPILTRPERLSWINSHYSVIRRLARAGVWIQITAGSLTGGFGITARYWAERMLEEGCVHILASDSHGIEERPPNLSEGLERAADRIGCDAAEHLVMTRPRAVIDDLSPATLPMPVAASNMSESTPSLNVDIGAHDDGPPRDRWYASARHAAADRGLAGWLWRHFE